ncbi:MAG: hypothetical protein LBQ62_08555, partial [Candidatus Accumulibacter sp.]|nr:hypothetical protein [Accumulibacter sp.]
QERREGRIQRTGNGRQRTVDYRRFAPRYDCLRSSVLWIATSRGPDNDGAVKPVRYAENDQNPDTSDLSINGLSIAA